MNWYLAKMVFRISCGDGNHMAQFDEQLRLVCAGDRLEAFQKSREMGKESEDIFFNDKRQLVQWQFINVCELYTLEKLADGAELYSRIEETADPAGYLSLVEDKAARLYSGETAELMNRS